MAHPLQLGYDGIVRAWVFFLFSLVSCKDSSPEEAIRRALQEASALSRSTWVQLKSSTESPGIKEGQDSGVFSLTYAFLVYPFEGEPVDAGLDFHGPESLGPSPVEIEEWIAAKEPITILQPECIQSVTYGIQGISAQGKVAFANGSYRGEAFFRAERESDVWTITEFILPQVGWTLKRNGARWTRELGIPQGRPLYVVADERYVSLYGMEPADPADSGMSRLVRVLRARGIREDVVIGGISRMNVNQMKGLYCAITESASIERLRVFVPGDRRRLAELPWVRPPPPPPAGAVRATINICTGKSGPEFETHGDESSHGKLLKESGPRMIPAAAVWIDRDEAISHQELIGVRVSDSEAARKRIRAHNEKIVAAITSRILEIQKEEGNRPMVVTLAADNEVQFEFAAFFLSSLGDKKDVQLRIKGYE